jgi:hypothetical protein
LARPPPQFSECKAVEVNEWPTQGRVEIEWHMSAGGGHERLGWSCRSEPQLDPERAITVLREVAAELEVDAGPGVVEHDLASTSSGGAVLTERDPARLATSTSPGDNTSVEDYAPHRDEARREILAATLTLLDHWDDAGTAVARSADRSTALKALRETLGISEYAAVYVLETPLSRQIGDRKEEIAAELAEIADRLEPRPT